METLEQRIAEKSRKNPNLSSLVVFYSVIQGIKYPAEFIEKAWDKFVDRDDYTLQARREIVASLV